MFAIFKYWILTIVLFLLLLSAGHAQDWEKIKSRGMMEFVVVAKEKEADENVYLHAIKQICTQGEYCRIMFWSNRDDVPMSWPMTDSQEKAMTADYFYNANSDEMLLLWNCRLGKNPSQCF